ncbi:helix-turn-helix domain-containing protein [Saccharopolyspora sp. MS10]|uniref:helix-turn-helix domain-containing protein n=1 Tax=Saccharopolyspora sp. MS10 TaxID=3385973 RepID=UPI00399FAA48
MTHDDDAETDIAPEGPGDGTEAGDPTRIGSRIAELRKIHGVTQRALSVRAAVSYSLLRKVERGERAASHSFVAAVARALSINITDLTDQPLHTRMAAPSSEQAGVPALRQALVEGDDPQLDTEPRDVEDLRAEVARLKEQDRRTRHAESVQALPDLLRHLHRAASEHPDDASVHELLATAYSYTVIALYRLGHLDLCHLADERARAAAARGADPVRGSVTEWNHALVLLFDGSYTAGLRSLDRSLDLLRSGSDTSATAAVRGAVHLRAAILAARTTDADLAETHLREARAMVRDGQDEANHYGTKFGATNVDIHGVAVPVELADGTTAVTRAATVALPEHTAPSRSGHYWIDLSRGWLLHGDRRRSLECLQTARRIAPQLTRFHPQVHETVQSLAASDARSTNSLSHFAAWCGMRR